MATDFRPGNALGRFAWEASNPGWMSGAAALAWKDFRLGVGGVGGGDAAPLIDPGTLEPREQRGPGLPSIVTSTRELNISFEPSGLAFFIAQLQKRSAAVTEITSGQSYLHKLAPNESSITFSPTFSLRIYRDTPFIETLSGCKVVGLTLNATTGAVVTGTVSVMAQRVTLYGPAVVGTEGGSPTSRPVLRGIPKWDYLKTALADPTVYVKYTQVSGPVLVKFKIGSAASYAGAAQTVAAATAVGVLNESDAAIYDPDSPVELFQSSLTGMTLNDEYSFPLRATGPWAASLPVLRALNVIHVTAKFAGTRKRVKSVNLSIAYPGDPDHNTGERYSPAILQLGQRVCTAQIARRHVDTEFEEYLRTGKAFSLDVEMDSQTVIGSSTDRYYARFITADARFEGNPPTPSSPGDFPESYACNLYPSSDGTHPDDLTVYLRNERSTLAT